MKPNPIIIALVLAARLSLADGGNFQTTLWYNRAADDYGLKSPLKCWEVENPNRTHKPNPDKAWEKYALPLGNGFIGAMVYGGVSTERIQFNEHSLWSGGPGSEGWTKDQNKHDAHEYLPEIRRALLDGDKKKAQEPSTCAGSGRTIAIRQIKRSGATKPSVN